MSFTDLTIANGWIPVQYGTDPLLRDVQKSFDRIPFRIETGSFRGGT